MEQVKEQIIKNKWSDPVFRRDYFRMKQQEYRGIKRHPNVMEDGSKWSDKHPFGKYNSFQEFNEATREAQKVRRQVEKETKVYHCDTCNVDYKRGDRHNKSSKHIFALRILEDKEFVNDILSRNTIKED